MTINLTSNSLSLYSENIDLDRGSMQTSKYLDWTQRPNRVQNAIFAAWIYLVNLNKSSWGQCNGAETYSLCEIDEHLLIKKIIQQASQDRKDFYILDIGAGNFQWSESIADFINEQADLPKAIKVYILGIRGESYFGNPVVEKGQCIIYNLGAFKVEELFEKLKEEGKELGFDLENKIDLAVSHWCFRHLVDPVGTVAQVYNLLRPKGYFLVDGFFFSLNGEKMEYRSGKTRMTQLFLDMKAPFLTQYNDYLSSLNHFIIQRTDNAPCQIPMMYSEEIDYPKEGWQVGSGYITRFQRESQEEDAKGFCLPHSDHSSDFYGDKKIYDWLKKSGVLMRKTALWHSLRDNDPNLCPIHQAIIKGKSAFFEACFEPPEEDINGSDLQGNTPLHIAIRKKSHFFFRSLLDKGAQTDLYNGQGNTPLHEAAVVDNKGYFLESLIEAGAQVNARCFRFSASPLDCAIEAKNHKAIEILIKYRAEISEKNRLDLEDPVSSAKCGVLIRKTALWHSLRDNAPDLCPIHQAIIKGKSAFFEACFEPPEEDINGSDLQGNTPLHIAIRKKSHFFFRSLLDKGAQTDLYNGQGNTPLHEAAVVDNKGYFLESLIEAGAQVNARCFRFSASPLDCAIEAKNHKAIEILIKYRAEVSKKNRLDLEDPVSSAKS